MRTKKNVLKKKSIAYSNNISEIVNLIEDYGLKPITIGPYSNSMYKSVAEYELSKDYDRYTNNIVFQEKDTKLIITTKYYKHYGKVCSYIIDLNDEEFNIEEGLDAYIQFSKAYKVPKVKTYNWEALDRWLDIESNKYICSAKPILDYNEDYEAIELKDVYEYDLNSAYASVILKGIPDLYHPIYGEKVKKGEVGFLLDDELTMILDGYSDIKFKMIPCPDSLKDYIVKWYTLKKENKNKNHAKAMLNLPIGYCQRTNPFLRAYVVHSCNNVIKALINDQTICWNTDALFSLKRRVDVELGDEIGMFKEIRLHKFIYVGNNYQVNDEKPTYRGIPKAWYTDDDDLMTVHQESVTRFNKWIWNPEELKLYRNERSLNEEIKQSSESKK